ncbi:MAG: hypothetical protein Q4B72_14445, partial [Lachnospiraceae bacterium]|nr:hypothetical protein [Lachnospiraceae bacterium]
HDKQDANAKFTVLEDLTDGLCYSNVYPNVDLEYILDSVYLKENIVLKDKTASNRYVINYHIGDLEAEQVDAQEIALKDSSGKPIFTIIAPYMSDAAEKICEKV